MAAAVVLVGLLVGGGAVYIGQAFASGGYGQPPRYVTGTFTTQRSYLPPCTTAGADCPTIGAPYSVTIVDYNVESLVYSDGVQTGSANDLATLAVASNGIGYLTGENTFWGTVGNSATGAYSSTVTDTINLDVSTYPTSVPISGNWVITQGSGMGGLAGICGSATFAGTVNLDTGAGSFTYTLTYGYTSPGGQCFNQ
jgi:hypothetical protein